MLWGVFGLRRHDPGGPEVRGQVEIGVDLGFFNEKGKAEIAEIRRIERLLFGYIKYIEGKNVR
jgi:hypothetical protein